MGLRRDPALPPHPAGSEYSLNSPRMKIVLLACLGALCLGANAKGTITFDRIKISDAAESEILLGSDAEPTVTCTCESSLGDPIPSGPYENGVELGDVPEKKATKCSDTEAETCVVCKLGEGDYLDCSVTDSDGATADDDLINMSECGLMYEDFAASPEVTCEGVGNTGSTEPTILTFTCEG